MEPQLLHVRRAVLSLQHLRQVEELVRHERLFEEQRAAVVEPTHGGHDVLPVLAHVDHGALGPPQVRRELLCHDLGLAQPADRQEHLARLKAFSGPFGRRLR